MTWGLTALESGWSLDGDKVLGSLYLIYLYECFACMYVYVPHVCPVSMWVLGNQLIIHF